MPRHDPPPRGGPVATRRRLAHRLTPGRYCEETARRGAGAVRMDAGSERVVRGAGPQAEELYKELLRASPGDAGVPPGPAA